MDDTSQGTPLLREYLGVFRRRWWIVALITVLAGTLGLGLALVETPIYASHVSLVVEPLQEQREINNNLNVTLAQQDLETQLFVITSEPVAERVIAELGLETTPDRLLRRVTAARQRNTFVYSITAADPVATRAAELAQGFADAYLGYRREQTLRRVLDAVAELRARSGQIRERIQEIERRTTTASASQDAALEEERQTLVEQLGQISAQLTSLSAAETIERSGGEILRDAQVPNAPMAPQPVRQTALALLLGLGLGLAAALVRDLLDDRIEAEDQVVGATQGRPVLGLVPVVKEDLRRLPILTAPASSIAESYRTLATNLLYVAGRNRYRSIVIISASQGEGKSTVAANLAAAVARSGSRTILVDADLRAPRQHEIFGMPEGRGLTDVLIGRSDVAEVLTDVGEPNLRVLQAGGMPPNPSELLGSEEMTALMRALSGLADLVVFDTPPALAFADALPLAAKTEAALFVAEYRRSGLRPLRLMTERVRRVGANIIGTALVRVPPELAPVGHEAYSTRTSASATEERSPVA